MQLIKRWMTARKYWPRIIRQTTGRWSIHWWDWILIFGN